MATFFSILGVILLVLAIGFIIYWLFFRKNKIAPPPPPVPDPDPTMLPSVLLFKLESTGQMYRVTRIPEKGGVTVGRCSPSDIIVTSDKGNYLSREHFVIAEDSDGMFINVTDHAHESGNGIRLEPDMKAKKVKSSISITSGLTIYIGNDSITFYLPHDYSADDAVTPVASNRVTRRE